MSKAEFSFKPRTYLHFDLPISRKQAETIACNPEAVGKRAFLPFIGYKFETPRIKRTPSGALERTTKTREIKIASHTDAAIYAHYGALLSPLYEKAVEDKAISNVVTAFRRLTPGKCNIDHAKEVFSFIESHRPCVALAFDIEKFFDRLDHQLLKMRWCELLGESRLPRDHFALFKSLTNFSFVDREELLMEFGISTHNPKAGNRRRICNGEEFRNRVRGKGLLRFNPSPGKGIPQGSPVSALLSNIYMLEFDHRLSAAISEVGGLYRRYCDDIMLVVPLDCVKLAEDLVHSLVARALLNLNEAKTDRVLFPIGLRKPSEIPGDSTGFSSEIQYLGFNYSGDRTFIRLSSISRYYGKMRAGVRLARQTQRRHNRLEIAHGEQPSSLKKRKIFIYYSYLINRRFRGSQQSDPKTNGNFLSYAFKAARILNAPEIKRQVRNHWKALQAELRKPINGQITQK